MALNNVIKSVFNEDKNNHYYNIFLEKKLYMNYLKNKFLYKILIMQQANQKSVTSVIIGIF